MKVMKKMKFLIAAAAVMFLAGNATAQDISELYDKYDKAVEEYNAKKYAEALPLLEDIVAEAEAFDSEGEDLASNAKKLIPRGYFQLGGASIQGGKFDDAITNFGKAVKTAESYRDMAILNRAKEWLSKSYDAKGADAFNNADYATAAESFAEGYEMDPNNTGIALKLAKSYSEMGDTENGFKIYREVIALGEGHSMHAAAAEEAKNELGYYMTLGASQAAEAKDYDTANAIIDNVLASEPTNPTANLMLIQVASAQKNWDKIIAKGEAVAALQTDEDMKSEAHFLLGAAYQNKENKAKAIENYRKVTSGKYAATAKSEVAELSK